MKIKNNPKTICIILLFIMTALTIVLLAANFKVKIRINYRTDENGICSIYYNNGSENSPYWDELHVKREKIEASTEEVIIQLKLYDIEHLRLDISEIQDIDFKNIVLEAAGIKIININSEKIKEYNLICTDTLENTKSGWMHLNSANKYTSIILPTIERNIIRSITILYIIIAFMILLLLYTFILMIYIHWKQKINKAIVSMLDYCKKKYVRLNFHLPEMKNDKKETKFAHYAGLLFVILVSIFVTSLFALYGEMDPHHDGFIFKTSLDIARGKVMFKETYSQYGALVFYMNAFFMRLFGETILTIRLVTIAFYTASFGIMYLICKRFFSTFYSIVVFLITLGMAHFYFTAFFAWPSVYALCFLLLSAYFLILFLEKDRYIYIILCAIQAGMAFWTRQPVGLVLFLAFYLSAALLLLGGIQKKKVIKISIIYFFSYLIFNISILFFLITQNAFSDWWIQSIKMMNDFAGTGGNNANSTIFDLIGKVLRCLFPIKPLIVQQSLVWTLFPCVCLIVFVIYLAACCKRKKNSIKRAVSKRIQLIIIITVYSLASWHQYYPVNDQLHMYWAAIPMFIILAYVAAYTVRKLFYKLFKSQSQLYFDLLGTALMCAILFSALSFRMQEGYYKVSQEYDVVENRTYPFVNGIRLPSDIAVFYQSLTDNMAEQQRKYATKDIVNMTSEGFYSSFSKENITPKFYGDSKYYNSKEKRENYIKDQSPIIIDYEGRPRSGYHSGKVITGFSGNIYGNKNNVEIYLPDDIQIFLMDGFTSEKNGGIYGNDTGRIYLVNNTDENQKIRVKFKAAVLTEEYIDFNFKIGDEQKKYKVNKNGTIIEEIVKLPANSKIIATYELSENNGDNYGDLYSVQFYDTSFFDYLEGVKYDDFNRSEEKIVEQEKLELNISNNKQYINIYNNSDTIKYIKLQAKNLGDISKLNILGLKCTNNNNSIKWKSKGEIIESVESFVIMPRAGIELYCDNPFSLEEFSRNIEMVILDSIDRITMSMLTQYEETSDILIENNTNGVYYVYYSDPVSLKGKLEILYPYKRKIILIKNGQNVEFIEKVAL